jgi:hypothetical protein
MFKKTNGDHFKSCNPSKEIMNRHKNNEHKINENHA